MSIDEQLTGALRGAAGPLPDDVGGWREVQHRGQRARRRRSGQAGVAAVTVLALGVGVFAATRSDDEPSVVTTPPSPSRVIATVDGSVVVLDAADGRVVSTLVPRGDDGATAVSGTPDGATVFYQLGEQCGRQPEIWSVPTSGGAPTQVVTTGQFPLVSPDGRFLAYAGTANAAPGDCGPFDRLAVRDLATGAERHLDYTPTGSVVPLTWSPASDALVVAGNEFSDGNAFKLIDVSPDGAVSEVGDVAAPSGNGYQFLPSGEPISAFPTDAASRIATFAQDTGAEGRTVAEVSAPLYLIGVDPTGTEFLLEGPLADTPDGHDLYRATVDDPTPVKLASKVRGAAWLPPSAAPPSSVTTTTSKAADGMPGTIVAVENGLVELDSRDGSVRRTIRNDRDLLPMTGQLSLSPGGGTAAVSKALVGDACATGTPNGLELVDLETGEARAVPSVDGTHQTYDQRFSPDGGHLAYLFRDCVGNSHLVVHDLASGDSRVFVGREGDLAHGPGAIAGWDGDSQHLVVLVSNGGAGEHRRIDAFREPAILDGEDVGGPVGDNEQIVALGETGRWAVTSTEPERWRLLDYDLTTQSVGAPILTWGEPRDATIRVVATDASGRHFLLWRRHNAGGTLHLYRFSVGDDRLTELPNTSLAADW
jgi:hypothetical protein